MSAVAYNFKLKSLHYPVALALYGRPYAAALFLTIATLWCLWRLLDRPSTGLAVLCALQAGARNLFAEAEPCSSWQREIVVSGCGRAGVASSAGSAARKSPAEAIGSPPLWSWALGWKELRPRLRRFLLGAILCGARGAMTADAVCGYFFATQHVLFVSPALVMLPVGQVSRPIASSGRARFWRRSALPRSPEARPTLEAARKIGLAPSLSTIN